jgi:predicted RNA-binding protein with EMAP domain
MREKKKGNVLGVNSSEGLEELIELQETLDLLRYRSLVSESKASKEQVQEIVDEISEGLIRRKDKSA